MTFKPHKSFIIVPRTAYVSVYEAPNTIVEVEYYSPGRFKVLQKIGECDTQRGAQGIIKELRRHA